MKIQRLRKKYCENCGQKDKGMYPSTLLPDNLFYEGLVLHHIIPLISGGNHMPDNLITLCYNCHKAIHTQPDGKNNWNFINEDLTTIIVNKRNGKN